MGAEEAWSEVVAKDPESNLGKSPNPRSLASHKYPTTILRRPCCGPKFCKALGRHRGPRVRMRASRDYRQEHHHHIEPLKVPSGVTAYYLPGDDLNGWVDKYSAAHSGLGRREMVHQMLDILYSRLHRLEKWGVAYERVRGSTDFTPRTVVFTCLYVAARASR